LGIKALVQEKKGQVGVEKQEESGNLRHIDGEGFLCFIHITVWKKKKGGYEYRGRGELA